MDLLSGQMSHPTIYRLRSYQGGLCFVNKAGYLVHSVIDLHHALYQVYVIVSYNKSLPFIIYGDKTLYLQNISNEGKVDLCCFPKLIFETLLEETESRSVMKVFLKNELNFLVANHLGRILLSQDKKIFYLEPCDVEKDGVDLDDRMDFFDNLRIMSVKDTLKYIAENKCSVARFGDGEFRWMLMRGEPQWTTLHGISTKLATIIQSLWQTSLLKQKR